MEEKTPFRLYIIIAVFIFLQIFISFTMIPPLRAFLELMKRQPSIPRPPQKQSVTKIYSHNMIDKCHLFSGESWPQEEMESISGNAPFFLNVLTYALKPDKSQLMSLMLYDTVRKKDKLVSQYFSYFQGPEGDTRMNPLYDGVSYIFYDLGGDPDSTKFNLDIATREADNIDILVAPTDIDYVLISTLKPDHFAGGMSAMMKYRPKVPVFVPPWIPGKDVKELFSSYGCEIENLIVLPAGYSQMSSRIGILVLPCEESPDAPYEADLVVKIKGGIAVIAGAGGPGMEKIISEAEKNTGQHALLYAGGTNFLTGMEEDMSIESMKRIAKSCPGLRICSNYSTSKLADYNLKSTFGKNYYSVHQGTTIRLPNPSLLYRYLEK